MVSATINRTGDPQDVSIATALVQAPLFGRSVVFSFSGYNFGQSFQVAGGNAITFGMRPAPDAGCSIDATRNGMFQFRHTNNRLIEQRLMVPYLYGEMLGFSQLDGLTLELGDVGAGRELSKAILRKFESAIETVRQNLIRNLGSELRAEATAAIHKMFGAVTDDSIKSILGAVNWAYLLSPDGRTMPSCGEQAMDILAYTLDHNPPAAHPITFTGESEIPLLSSESISFDNQGMADLRATTLLFQVCGKAHGEHFKRHGRIVIKKNGYEFSIRPGDFVDCTDPNGHSSRLCIHTVSHTCNPIDEVIIAYLNILHHFDEYMDMAIVHSPQAGFTMPKKKAVA